LFADLGRILLRGRDLGQNALLRPVDGRAVTLRGGRVVLLRDLRVLLEQLRIRERALAVLLRLLLLRGPIAALVAALGLTPLAARGRDRLAVLVPDRRALRLELVQGVHLRGARRARFARRLVGGENARDARVGELERHLVELHLAIVFR